MSLHGPVHGEEVALQEPAERGGSHLPHLATRGTQHSLFMPLLPSQAHPTNPSEQILLSTSLSSIILSLVVY